MTLILGIETSCDETAAAIVRDGIEVISDVVASQINLHAPYGGVFPEMASRAHIEAIYPVIHSAFEQADLRVTDIDAIAVTQGPGLAGSLVVGMNAAKGLALASGKPLVAVNHLEGHIHSLWLQHPEVEKQSNQLSEQFPVIVLIVSGGHTSLILMRDHGDYLLLGQTIDDAAGEAFDKVARLLDLPYPGGPAIQISAEKGDSERFSFPRSWLKTDSGAESFNFSFSGIKTAVLRTLERLQPGYKPHDAFFNIPISDLAASFQAAVVDVLVTKTLRAAEVYQAKEILIAGGVSANAALRKAFIQQSPIQIRMPPLDLCTDNAVMVASAGYYQYRQRDFSVLGCDVKPNLPISEIGLR